MQYRHKDGGTHTRTHEHVWDVIGDPSEGRPALCGRVGVVVPNRESQPIWI